MCLGLATLHASAAPPSPDAERVVVGRGSVASPGPKWRIERGPEGEEVAFRKTKTLKPGAVSVPLLSPKFDAEVSIRVFRNRVLDGDSSADAAKTAADFFDREEAIMRSEGKGSYSLENVDRRTRTIAGRMHYLLTFRTGTWTWSQPSALYLWFPDDFAMSREFYGFLIVVHVPLEGTRAAESLLEDVEPVIASFRLEGEAR